MILYVIKPLPNGAQEQAKSLKLNLSTGSKVFEKKAILMMHVRFVIQFLKELRHHIPSHFFDGLNCSLSVGKPKNNSLLRKKNTKGWF